MWIIGLYQHQVSEQLPLIKANLVVLKLIHFFRYDAYPEFLSEVRPTDNYFVKLQGSSFGLNLNYKMPLLKGLKLLAGNGYYKNRFDKIIGRNRRGQNDNRLIAILPPPPIFLPYFTDKYFYQCLSINIGIENNFRLSKNYLIPVGAILQNNFTFSQYYHLTNNPIGSLDYNRKESKYNGFSAIACVGLHRSAGKFSFGPQLIIPVYDRLTTDNVFPKETSEGNPPSKWFRGIGLGFTCNYLLTRKN